MISQSGRQTGKFTLQMPGPLVIAVAPNGARRTKVDHPSLPITSAELADCAAACAEAGASMIHLHVRDAAQQHSLDPKLYRAALASVRSAIADRMVVQVTTEAVGRYSPAEQMAVVRDLMPEAISLAVRELLPEGEPENEVAAFLVELEKAGTLVQYILYSVEELKRYRDLVRRGVVPNRKSSVLFVLGRYSKDQRSTPEDLLPFLELDARPHSWMCCAFGPRETDCMLAAAVFGGHARIGFENNLYLPDGTIAPDNATLVRALSVCAAASGRRPAKVDEARRILSGEPWVVPGS